MENIESIKVSIVIVTYNSEKTILELLESIHLQDYENIELIISDDHSTDNTVSVCQRWLTVNNARFIKVILVNSKVNTGISGNLNRGIKESSGDFIKIIGGDDRLKKYAISRFTNFTKEKKSEICVSRLELFNDNGTITPNIEQFYESCYNKLSIVGDNQLSRICRELFIPGPGIFFSRKIYECVNGFDETYPFNEEWPFFFKVLKLGYKVNFLDESLIEYRISYNSLSRDGDKSSYKAFKSVKEYFFKERRAEMIKNFMLLDALDQTRRFLQRENSYHNNSNSIVTILCLAMINPISYIKILKKIYKTMCSKAIIHKVT